MRSQPPKFHARVTGMAHEAEDIMSLTLAAEDGAALPAWEPGAHVDLYLGEALERQYSLCGDPNSADVWTVAVLCERPSRGGSEFVHAQLSVGDVLDVQGPRTGFPLVDADRHLFIGGGIGVTPLLPMAERLAGTDRSWQMVYGGRRRASMAFIDRLRSLGDQVTVWPEDERGVIDLPGLLGEPQPGTAVYCCGPESLLHAVELGCESWPPGSLHIERCHPMPGALDGVNTAFEVVLAQAGITVAVAADQTIVEAVEEAGIDVPTSCREGTCGTCETELLDGVADHRDSFLSEEEKQHGATVMVCCSRALSPRLVLDL
jgi:ferredoxin-NADP reductase